MGRTRKQPVAKVIYVRVTDPALVADIEAFCDRNQLTYVALALAAIRQYIINRELEGE